MQLYFLEVNVIALSVKFIYFSRSNVSSFSVGLLPSWVNICGHLGIIIGNNLGRGTVTLKKYQQIIDANHKF